MSHQPFEDWMLGDEALAAEDERRLQEHLDSCAHCAALAGAWEEVEGRLRPAALVSPAPGFAGRWLVRLYAERARSRRRQAWVVLTVLCGLGLPLALLYGARVLAMLDSPAYLALRWMESLADFVGRLYVVREIVVLVLDVIRSANPALLGLGLVAALGALGTLWVGSVYRFAYQGGRQ